MTNQADVCLTFDAACDAALEMENRIYRNYLEALRTVKDQAALAILRDAALVKLEHKHKLQMAEDALEFYRNMSEHCSGAPMAELFKSLGDDQTKHLQQLEDDYEEHFLT